MILTFANYERKISFMKKHIAIIPADFYRNFFVRFQLPATTFQLCQIGNYNGNLRCLLHMPVNTMPMAYCGPFM